MNQLRLLLASAALAAVTLTGCFLVSGQFLVTLDLDPVTVVGTGSITGLRVDLTTESKYQDHKDKIKDIADFAVLGTVTNNIATPLSVEIYMVPTLGTTTLSLSEIQSQGTLIWGPLVVGGNSAVIINWDQSAALFGTAGKAALLSEVKGDGQFRLFAVGNGNPNFTITEGKVVLVIAAGT